MAVQRLAQRLGTCVMAISLGLVIGGIAACGGSDEPEAAAPGTETPAAGAPQPTPPAGGGVVLEQTTGELPKAYPSDLPVYPGADPENSMLIPGTGGIVTFGTDASPEEVYAFFQEQLPAQGWEIRDQSENPRRILTEKGSRRATILARPREEGTEISLAIEGI